eukprot:SM008645S22996  [mRNA]  locus=s8645:59:199:- [translate_table: standard]
MLLYIARGQHSEMSPPAPLAGCLPPVAVTVMATMATAVEAAMSVPL